MAGTSFADRLHQAAPEEVEHQPAPIVPGAQPAAEVALATRAATAEVVTRLSDPGGTLRRTSSSATDELGGTAVDPGVVTSLRRRAGKGRALDATGTALGSSLGIDPGTVSVHADREADTLARSMQAKAFTWGNDIYFTQGAYSPSTQEGKHVLAHELGHVAQQRPGAYGGSPMIGRADDPAERDADRLADLALSSLRPAADAVAPVAGVPDDVREGRELPTVRRLFGKLGKTVKKVKDKVNTFFGKAKPVDDEETGNDYIDDMTHEDRMTHQRRARGSGPGENPDFSETSLWGQDPNRFVVTLAVAQEDTGWMNNVNLLKKAAISELTSSPKKFINNISTAEKRLARKVLLKQGKLDNKTEKEINKLVKQFKGSIHDVGHTWVRLQTYVAPVAGKSRKAKPSGKGRLKELYSYGMWPQKIYDPQSGDWEGGYSGPLSVGPGEIKHPDVAHEDDPTKAYRDYEVTADQFDKALGMAVERYNSPPPYVLTGYNCTAFAREIVQAAGQTYPGSGLLPGFAYTPGNLYWAVMEEWAKGNPLARTMEKDEEAMAKLKTRHGTFGEAGKKNVDDEYDEAMNPVPESDTDGPARSKRQRFLDAGLQLYQGNGGGFEPPTGRDDTVVAHATPEQIPQIQERRTVGEWVEITVPGEFYWVHETDLMLFRNPTTPEALFDDEVSEISDVDDGSGSGTDGGTEDLLTVPTTSSPEVEVSDEPVDTGPSVADQATAVLKSWNRIGYELDHLGDILPYHHEGTEFTGEDLRSLLTGPDAQKWSEEFSKVLGCETAELMELWGKRL